MNEINETIKVGSRKSELALIQTNFIIEILKELHPNLRFKIVSMKTMGDEVLDKPLPKIGEKSLFTKELEIALERGAVDFVVHSLKDLPTTLPVGMVIGAVYKREDPCDALVLHARHKGKTMQTLPNGSVIGTSSLRRIAQLMRNCPHLRVEDIRGNLNTRLHKLDQGDKYDGIILAAAGIHRMGWKNRITQLLSDAEMMYAVGQGALAVECRESDSTMLTLLEPLSDHATVVQIVAERSFLSTLGGGCSAPVAVLSRLDDQCLHLTGGVWSLDGKTFLRQEKQTTLIGNPHSLDDWEPPRKCPYREPRLYCGVTPGMLSAKDLEAAEKLGAKLAAGLIKQGALDIMAAARNTITATS